MQEGQEEKVQKAASITSAQIQNELSEHDNANPKKGSFLGDAVAVAGPEVFDFLKGLGKNQLDALVAYVGAKFAANYIQSQSGQ